ncbi:pentapeptide repeat-containing protein [Pedobacter sp. L105]|uniref:pentapeptide repeat-containing protein n=1 Tax=Pedobacter sp. L105 TaxID=1641871 RepID=UPI00131B1CA2|nr:pentapeptide repeat-containing protein [Pedobacter sp. L105]
MLAKHQQHLTKQALIDTFNDKKIFTQTNMKRESGKIYRDMPSNSAETIFENCTFENIIFDSSFDYSEINKSKFYGCHFLKVKFKRDQLQQCEFENSNFQYCRFMFSDLNNSRLTNCEFHDSYFFASKLNNSVLQNVIFKNCNLNIRTFESSSLVEVDFSNHKLESTNFTSARFDQVNFENARLFNWEFNNATFLNCSLKNAIVSGIGSGYELILGLKESELEEITFNKIDTFRIRFYLLSSKIKFLITNNDVEKTYHFLSTINLNKINEIIFKHFNRNENISNDWEPDEMVNGYLNLAKNIGRSISALIKNKNSEVLMTCLLKLTDQIDSFEYIFKQWQEKKLYSEPDLVDDFGIDEEEQIMRALRNGTADAFGF